MLLVSCMLSADFTLQPCVYKAFPQFSFTNECFPENHVSPLQDGRVLDRASDQLSKVRGQRRDNMQSLRQSMNEWARKLAAQNVSEEALVVIRRDRLCVPVKAGRQVGTTGKLNVPHLPEIFNHCWKA